MLSYVTLGTNNMEKALAFYDALLAKMNGKRVFAADNGQFYGFGEGSLLGVFKPADGEKASNGNGTMFAFKVNSREEVRNIHAKALALGARDAGLPGPRGDRGFYAAYFRDPDDNKICVYIM